MQTNELVRELVGLAPGERVALPRSVPRPPYSTPFAWLCYWRMSLWADSLTGERTRRITAVPVWWAQAEDDIDVGWDRGIVGVEGPEEVVFAGMPRLELDAVVRLHLKVREVAYVELLQDVPVRVPIQRQMGPYGVVRRLVEVSMLSEPEVLPGAALGRPTVTLEPWTQVVRPAVSVEGLPVAVSEALGTLSDV